MVKSRSAFALAALAVLLTLLTLGCNGATPEAPATSAYSYGYRAFAFPVATSR